jgi:hypothetical protein
VLKVFSHEVNETSLGFMPIDFHVSILILVRL